MRTSTAKDQRRGMRGTIEARQRKHTRLRPNLMVLEERTLLSVAPQTYTVTNTNVSGTGSLLAAVLAADADTYSGSAADTIAFSSLFSTPQTITLSSHLTVNSNVSLVIAGPAAGVAISGGGHTQVFSNYGTASFSNLEIIDGGQTASGGGMYNNGNLQLTNVVFSGNHSAGDGGGLYDAGGTVTLNNTTFSSDTALAANGKPGNAATFVFSPNNPADNVHSGPVTILSDPSGAGIAYGPTAGGGGGSAEGGGIYVAGGTLTITNSVFSSDSVEGGGGGNGGSSAFLAHHQPSTAQTSHYLIEEALKVDVVGKILKPGIVYGRVGDGGGGGSAVGGGLMVAGGAVTITNTIFSSCEATGGNGGAIGPAVEGILGGGGDGGNALGGALAANGSASITVLNTTFSSNEATGGRGGSAEEENVINDAGTYYGGGGGLAFGGAVFTDLSASGAPTIISNSTFNANSAVGGPGDSSADMGGGDGYGEGGGLMQYLGNAATVSDCTFSGDVATTSGLDVSVANMTLNNTILSDIAESESYSFLTGGHNLIADASYSIAGLSGTVHGTALLGPLANNGGPTLGASIATTSPTLTLKLLPGTNPAIGAGSLALVPSGVYQDQRGYLRADNALMDIGAYEASEGPAVQSIAVTPRTSSNPELAPGVAAQFTAIATLAGGSTLNITNYDIWASATPTVAAIGGTGLAMALAPGTSVITASLGGVTTAVTLTVLAPSFVVNTIQDLSGFYTGVTSLREAIAEASGLPGAHTITFDPTVFATAQTITLTGGPLTPGNTSGKLTITGPAAGVTISGNNKSRDFQIANSGTSVEFDNLTITGGLAKDNGVAGAAAGSTAALGGGILNNGGTLTFNNVAFTSNLANGAAGQGAMGGAVETTGGSVSFTNCTFTSNTAQGGSAATAMGGAVYSAGSTVNLSGCTFTSNTAQGGQGIAGAANKAAGGIAGSGGAGGNGDGGGVAAEGSGAVTLTLCTFTSDRAGGGNGGAGGANTGTSGTSGSGGSGGGGYGGGLMADAGSVSIQTTTFASCTAGGATGGRGGDNTSSTVTAGTGGNGGAGQGGGLAVLGTGTATVLDTTFSLDTARGGVGGQSGNNNATSNPARTTAGGSGGTGEGGAVWADGNSVTITNTTLSGDNAAAGLGGAGGASPNLNPALVNINGSSGVGEGGGLLLASGTAKVSDSTFVNVNASANGGGGIAILAGTATVNNTILGSNTGGDIVKTGGTLTGGYNLIADTTYAIAGLLSTVHANPQLGALDEQRRTNPDNGPARRQPRHRRG
jgi:hypothetical protein